MAFVAQETSIHLRSICRWMPQLPLAGAACSRNPREQSAIAYREVARALLLNGDRQHDELHDSGGPS
jgi:hypothetical protein